MKKKAENNGIVSRGFVFGADGVDKDDRPAGEHGRAGSFAHPGRGLKPERRRTREAAARLADVILQCSRQAGVDPGMIRAAVLGLAGAGETGEEEPRCRNSVSPCRRGCPSPPDRCAIGFLHRPGGGVWRRPGCRRRCRHRLDSHRKEPGGDAPAKRRLGEGAGR